LPYSSGLKTNSKHKAQLERTPCAHLALNAACCRSRHCLIFRWLLFCVCPCARGRACARSPGYQAPEVLNRVPYGFSADVWSLGITIYELLEKNRPFHTQDDVLSGSPHLYFVERVSGECKDFLSRLLTRDVHKRYGCGKEGISEIKRHPWFKGINWKEREEKKVAAPFLPDLDRANCSADFELADQFLSDKKEPDINEEDQTNFSGFEYNVNPPTGSTFELPQEKKKK
jgi:serine/threonine protein kinase